MNDPIQLSYRPVEPADYPAILEVYRQCEDFLALGPVPTASMEMVLADLELSRQAGGIFNGIFTTNGTLVGVVDYVPHHYAGQPEQAYLALLMIGAPYRNQGIGKRVVEWVEGQIRQDARVTAIVSGVQANNPQAIRFWLRMGYKITGGPELMPDQTTAYHLIKYLGM